MLAEKQRASELARSRQRVEQLQTELPALIEDHVGEHIQKLEHKLLTDFKEMGQRAIEESTTALNDQLNGRIETLEEISALQSRTILNLRDSSKIAEQKVSAVVNSIEKALAGSVPGGFELEPAAFEPLPPSFGTTPAAANIHSQFQIPNATAMVKADTQEVDESKAKSGFCPNCTSTNVRRANRSGLFEEFLRLFFIAPFRCRACRHKFYRF